jgi:hypothetical protein
MYGQVHFRCVFFVGALLLDAPKCDDGTPNIDDNYWQQILIVDISIIAPDSELFDSAVTGVSQRIISANYVRSSAG